MPRSGTSLVTQLLHRCGLHLGRRADLMPPAGDNRDGYWENLQFVRLNERLLASGGGTWFAPPPAIRPTPAITADAAAVVAQFAGREPWGWKDPRNAVTLPFWKSLLPSLKVVVCLRHPAEAAASLAASALVPRGWRFYWPVTRHDSPIVLPHGARRSVGRVWGAARATASGSRRRALIEEVGLQVWRLYNTTLLAETSPATRLVTHYDAVLARPRAELERILAFTGIDAPAAVVDEAIHAVSPDLRHQRARASLDPELARLYAALSREAGCAP